jgi:AGCS family alanine or glycine:cation symporter
MAVINLTAILLLSGTVYKLTKDYFGQRRAGKEPTFEVDKFDGPKQGVSEEIWTEDANVQRV